jgi:hypothetical protein
MYQLSISSSLSVRLVYVSIRKQRRTRQARVLTLMADLLSSGFLVHASECKSSGTSITSERVSEGNFRILL